jgi:hypothetical protein
MGIKAELIMNDLDTLKAAIKRRGYAVADRTHAEFPNMIILWIARDDGRPVETSPGIQRVIWRGELDLLLCDPSEHCDRMLSSMSGGQWHMRCANCDEPLLMGTEERVYPRLKPAPVVWPLDFPERFKATEILKERVTEPVYRSARTGPGSPRLSRCPACQTLLSEQTVAEIDDTASQLGEVMSDLETRYGTSVQVQYVQSGARHDPLTIAQWSERIEAWGQKGQGKVPSARQVYEAIPRVAFAHPVELREDGSEIWSRRTGQILFKVLREKGTDE